MTTLPTRAVFCIAENHVKALSILNHLRRSGFPDSDISTVLAPARQGGKVAAGVGGGLLAGGILGWMAGMGGVSGPGLGPFIAAGPIMALGVAAIGSSSNELTDGLIGLGLSEYEAKQYETYLTGGNALISVGVINDDEVDVVRSIFEEDGADRISVQTVVDPETSGERSFSVGAAQAV